MLKNITQSLKNLTSARGLALAGILLAIYGVLGSFKIPVPPDPVNNRISLTFLATGMAGMFLGPVPAMLIGALGDILGYMINSYGGAFFPGFTLSAALAGFTYGICLYKKNGIFLFIGILVSSLVIAFGINIVLNTIWLEIMYKKAYTIFSAARVIKNICMYPVHVILLYIVAVAAERTGIKKRYLV